MAKTYKCPDCGHPLIDPTKIGLTKKGWGELYCPMNMPYLGCGASFSKADVEKASLKEDIHQVRDIRHQCKKCGNLWVGPASEEECPKCHAREYDESVLLKAIRGGDHLMIAEALGQVMRAKVRTRLAEEKQNVAATLLYPKIAEATDRGLVWAVYNMSAPYGGGEPEDGKYYVSKSKALAALAKVRAKSKLPGLYDIDQVYFDGGELVEGTITEGFRSGEKVVLAHCTVFGSYKALDGKGQYRTVPIGSTGEYVRAKDSTWSIVWFPEFYESASVKTEDLVPVSQAHLYERKMAKCVGCGEVRTLDDEGLCHECWQAKRDHEAAKRGEFDEAADRCDAKDKGGVQCVLKPGHSGKHQGHSGHLHKIWESGGWLGSTPGDLGRMAAADDDYNERIKPGDRVRTKRMGQTPGTVVKVENGNVYFELDEPAGKYGKRVWAAPLSNIVKEANEFTRTKCRVCEKPMTVAGNQPRICAQCTATQKAADSRKKVNEATVSQHEVQRIYDEIGDLGETELLCGISDLRINQQGQVISYICEAAKPTSREDVGPADRDGYEASELGLRPGQWPYTVVVDGTTFTRVSAKRDREGDVEYVNYRTLGPGNRVIKVFND